MRLLEGTKTVETPEGWGETLRRESRRLVVDVGSGDGRYVYESARHDPESTYVALEPDVTTLSEYSFRASRKPARGGVGNACFVVASLEQVPAELVGLADLVRVNFPWGSLLRGLLQPNAEMLRALSSLGRVEAAFELVLSYDPLQDPNAFSGEPLPSLDEVYIEEALSPAYEAVGLHIEQQRRLGKDEALAIPSSWGRRLLHGRPRSVFMVSGTVRSGSSMR